jgi:2-oxoglutarate ferredoxin oxidoreductase subunit gamma
VIASDEDIDYPKAVSIDLLLALTQESVNRYARDVKPGGVVVVDEEAAGQVPPGDYRIFRLAITRIARDQVGRAIVANIVALGVITEVAGVVSHQAVEAAILARVPKGTEELNLRAFKAGAAAARALLGAPPV